MILLHSFIYFCLLTTSVLAADDSFGIVGPTGQEKVIGESAGEVAPQKKETNVPTSNIQLPYKPAADPENQKNEDDNSVTAFVPLSAPIEKIEKIEKYVLPFIPSKGISTFGAMDISSPSP